MPVSTRVHEASLVARLIGQLQTEHAEMVYAHLGASGRCPTETNAQQLNCTTTATFESQLPPSNCSNQTISQNFSSAAATAESLFSVSMATHDAVWKLMKKNTVLWKKLSSKSRNFLRSIRPLHAAITANVSVCAIFGDYSTVVDELMLLLPVPPSDVTLPQLLLCVHCETALFAAVSGLRTIASAQKATGSQCLLGYVFYACGHLAAVERFYFLSNRSRVESELKDVLNCLSDSTTKQLYADTIECHQRVFAAISAFIEQSRGCTTADDVSRWYSVCKEMLSGTNRVMESLIVRSNEKITAVWQRCMLEIVVYTLLICIQVC